MGLDAIRTQLKAALGATTAAGGYTLTSARIKLGFVRLGATDEFIKDIVTAGPMLVIKGGALEEYNRIDAKLMYGIHCDLYLGFNREADNALTNAEALLEAIFDKWVDNVNFLASGVTPPMRVSWSEPELNTEVNPVLCKYDITLQCIGC